MDGDTHKILSAGAAVIQNHGQSLPADDLCRRLRFRIMQSFDLSHAIETLSQAATGDFYLVGGSVRRALFENNSVGDLDLVLPNHDSRVFQKLDSLGVPYSLNSN